MVIKGIRFGYQCNSIEFSSCRLKESARLDVFNEEFSCISFFLFEYYFLDNIWMAMIHAGRPTLAV